MAEVLVAREDAALDMDGVPHVIARGVTFAHADHQIVKAYPDIWEPVRVQYSTSDPKSEPATATPDPGAQPVPGDKPEPKADKAKPEPKPGPKR